jgi:hypothetical protein
MRIRTIKPDFFLSESLHDAETETGLPIRIAFAGLWCAADREGRFEWRPRRLKTQILPYDGCDFSHVLDTLATRGALVKYTINGQDFGWIPGFTKHQVINNREKDSELPEPPEAALQAALTRAPHVEHTSATPAKEKKAEGKGREGKGIEEEEEEEEETEPAEILMTFPCDGPKPSWKFTNLHRDRLAKAYPSIDIEDQARQALAWVDANPTKRKTANGMPRFINGWIARAQNSGHGRPANGSAPAQPARKKEPTLWELQTLLENKQKRLNQLRSKSPGEHCNLYDFLSDDEKTELQALHKSIPQIQRRLSAMNP